MTAPAANLPGAPDVAEQAGPAKAAPARARRRRSRWSWRRVELGHVVLVLAALVVVYLAIVPVGTMLYASFQSSFLSGGETHWSIEHYITTFTSARFGGLVGNSFIYAGSSAAIGTAVGFGLAWLVSRTNTPGKSFARAAVLISFIIPGVLSTIAYALLLSPNTGPINGLLRDIHLPTFDIYSMAGMIFIQSTNLVPIAFLMATAAFVSMDRSLEEAALASGAAPPNVFFRITMRLVRPALLSAALLMFINTISGFEVPGLIGVPGREFVFVSEMYQSLRAFPADYGTASVIGVFVLSIAVVGLWFSRRLSRGSTQTITGKGFRPSVTDLGRWRWVGLGVFIIYFIVTVGLPLAMVIWSSLLPGYQPPSLSALRHISLDNYTKIWTQPALVTSVRNSIIASVATGVIVTILASVVAYITVRTKLRGRGLLEGIAMVPIAVPSIVLGIGVLFWYLIAPLPFDLYGTLAIIIIAFVTMCLPYAMRYMAPGMAQINDELEEAATANGASWLQTFIRVFAPLLMPSLLAAFVYSMVFAFREISAAIFLYSQGNEVVAVTIYDLWTNGAYPVVSALGVLMTIFLFGLVVIAQRFVRRMGIVVT